MQTLNDEIYKMALLTGIAADYSATSVLNGNHDTHEDIDGVCADVLNGVYGSEDDIINLIDAQYGDENLGGWRRFKKRFKRIVKKVIKAPGRINKRLKRKLLRKVLSKKVYAKVTRLARKVKKNAKKIVTVAAIAAAMYFAGPIAASYLKGLAASQGFTGVGAMVSAKGSAALASLKASVGVSSLKGATLKSVLSSKVVKKFVTKAATDKLTKVIGAKVAGKTSQAVVTAAVAEGLQDLKTDPNIVAFENTQGQRRLALSPQRLPQADSLPVVPILIGVTAVAGAALLL